MYTIYADGKLVYAPNLANIEDGGYAVVDPVVTSELNDAGSCQFKIPNINPMYDGIQRLKSVIKVYNGSERVFRGRILDDESDFWNRKEIYAEGALAFFNDSIVRPYTFTGSVSDYFSFLVNQHNEQVDAAKQFRVGRCTVTDGNNYIVRSNNDYPNTWQEIKDKLIELLGGYIMTRYEIENGEEVEYIDYLAESGGVSGQQIVFAENILDLTRHVDATDVCTVIIPLGKSDSNTGERLTIKDVNDGKDYLESATGIALYGRVTSTYVWDDVTEAANLKTKGLELLEKSILMAVSIDISAFDLHLLDVDTDSIRIGMYNRVISVPHGINSLFQCVKTKVNLKDADKSEYTFGATTTTLTSASAANTNYAASAASAAAVANIAANATANALNVALQEISQTYAALEARVKALEGN